MNNKGIRAPLQRSPERNRRLAATIALALLLAAILGAATTTGNPHTAEDTQGWPSPAAWPEYGGSLHRTGESPTAGPDQRNHAPNTETYSLHDRSFSSPVFDHQGNLYVGDISGRVTKLSPTLQEIWTSERLSDGEIRSSVLVAPDGNVYVAPAANSDTDNNTPDDGALFALDKETGQVQWSHGVENIAPQRTNYVLTAAPAYHPEGFILQASMDGHLYAVALDGELLWRFQTHDDIDNKVVSTPAIADDGTIYFGSQNGRLYALDPDGEHLWDYEAREAAGSDASAVEQIVAAPSIGPDGTVFFGTRLAGGTVGVQYAMIDQSDSAQLKWATTLDEKISAPAALLRDQALFVGVQDGTFYRIDQQTGDIQWTFNPLDDDPGVTLATGGAFGAGGRSLLAVAEQAVVDHDGRVYASWWHVDMSGGFQAPEHSRRSPVYALNADTGDDEWRRIYDNTQRAPAMMPTTLQTDDGLPIGILYFSGDDGNIRAVGGVNPDPVVLPAPSVPGDAPDAPDESEDDLTIMPDDVNETGNETSTENEIPDGNETDNQNGTDETGSTEDTQQQEEDNGNETRQGPQPLFEELPMPAVALLLIATLGMLALHRRRRA